MHLTIDILNTLESNVLAPSKSKCKCLKKKEKIKAGGEFPWLPNEKTKGYSTNIPSNSK